jgi:hypothetical protein
MASHHDPFRAVILSEIPAEDLEVTPDAWSAFLEYIHYHGWVESSVMELLVHPLEPALMRRLVIMVVIKDLQGIPFNVPRWHYTIDPCAVLAACRPSRRNMGRELPAQVPEMVARLACRIMDHVIKFGAGRWQETTGYRWYYNSLLIEVLGCGLADELADQVYQRIALGQPYAQVSPHRYRPEESPFGGLALLMAHPDISSHWKRLADTTAQELLRADMQFANNQRKPTRSRPRSQLETKDYSHRVAMRKARAGDYIRAVFQQLGPHARVSSTELLADQLLFILGELNQRPSSGYHWPVRGLIEALRKDYPEVAYQFARVAFLESEAHWGVVDAEWLVMLQDFYGPHDVSLARAIRDASEGVMTRTAEYLRQMDEGPRLKRERMQALLQRMCATSH